MEEPQDGGQRVVMRHTELRVFQAGYAAAMRLFDLSRRFPVEERFALTDQLRRSSRAVCVNLAEAWRKRRYEAAFVSKLSDCEAEAAETQTWIRFAADCGYLPPDIATELAAEYDKILGMLVRMSNQAPHWTI